MNDLHKKDPTCGIRRDNSTHQITEYSDGTVWSHNRPSRVTEPVGFQREQTQEQGHLVQQQQDKTGSDALLRN